MKTSPSIRYRCILFGTLLLLYGIRASAQSPADQDSARSRIAAIFAPFARTDAPGCVAIVFRDGGVLG